VEDVVRADCDVVCRYELVSAVGAVGVVSAFGVVSADSDVGC